jgi:hypothetical protein
MGCPNLFSTAIFNAAISGMFVFTAIKQRYVFYVNILCKEPKRAIKKYFVVITHG